MPLHIVQSDITKMQVDAIVNAANHTLLGGGDVDGSICRAAGPELRRECIRLGGCETGGARITGAGGRLPCKYVIHTVGPRWRDGKHGERELLASCYSVSLALAREHGCQTVAFPLISSGIFGYPKDRALRVAVDAICAFLMENEMTVYLVVFDKRAFRLESGLFSDIAAYIDDHYAAARSDSGTERIRRLSQLKKRPELPGDQALTSESQAFEGAFPSAPCVPAPPQAAPSCAPMSLDEALRQIDESFAEMLLRKIDEAGITDAQFYKRANMDRKLFSKIRGNKRYRPSKPTVLASAIALELTLEETQELLMKAGFALSHSDKFDIIVEYFIKKGNYNIFEINEALFAFDQNLLGS